MGTVMDRFSGGMRILSKDLGFSRIAGFSCNRAWIYLVFFSPHLTTASLLGGVALPVHSIISIFCLAVTLVVCAAMNGRTTAFLNRRDSLVIANAAMIIGSLLWVIAILFLIDSLLYLAFCGILTGLGSAVLLMQWGRVFSSLTATISSAESAFGYFIAAIAYLAIGFLPLPVGVTAILLLPLGSTYALIKQPTIVNRLEPEGSGFTAVRHDPFLLKLLVGTLCIGSIVGTASELYVSDESAFSPEGFVLQFFFASALAPLIMLLINLFSRRHEFGFSYRPMLVLMVFGVSMIPFSVLSPYVTRWVILIGYHFFDLMLWALLADLSYRFHISSVLAFGLGRGVLYLANGLGTCLGIFLWLRMDAPYSFALLSMASAIITLLLVVTFSFILTEKDLFSYKGVEKDGKPGSIMQSCGCVAEAYSLSPREEDVMRLMVKGRSIARIQDELYMSKGTVNTHLHHIYRKLGIHTKQELLDLVEKGARPDRQELPGKRSSRS